MMIRERVPPRRQAGEYLANERTFLAWVRTSVTIRSFGFIVAKFNLWLHEMADSGTAKINTRLANSSLQIGAAMIALGAVLVVLATAHSQSKYRRAKSKPTERSFSWLPV